jgi:2-dehydro-3-deoxygalactonokinase
MIGVDWGTSSFRAYRLDAEGGILDRRNSADGILAVQPGGFEEALRGHVGDWLAAGERRILLCGMVGSRQGWVEAPYLACPADAASIGAALRRIPFDGAEVLLVPGLSDVDAEGTPEVMRGEETQIIGALAGVADAIACLPGSHSKWAQISGGRIGGYRTYLSGETFSALRSGTILGRMMQDGPTDPAAFSRGLARAAEPGHLLHHLFGVRSLALFGRLRESETASYLSGLLIGHETLAARPRGQDVHLIGAEALCALYATAITHAGGTPILHDADAAARGLARIGANAPWN